MITKEKLEEFIRFDGDIDGYARAHTDKTQCLLTDEEWSQVSLLLTQVNTMEKGLNSKEYNQRILKNIEENVSEDAREFLYESSRDRVEENIVTIKKLAIHYMIMAILMLFVWPIAGMMVAFAHDDPNTSTRIELFRTLLIYTWYGMPIIWVGSFVFSILEYRGLKRNKKIMNFVKVGWLCWLPFVLSVFFGLFILG